MASNSVFFLPKARQMITGTNTYRLGNILLLARRYCNKPKPPEIQTKKPQTHGLKPTANESAGTLKENMEVSIIEGNRELAVKTLETAELRTSGLKS